MKTLEKKRRKNQLLSPRFERMMTPWTNNLFPFTNEAVNNLLNFRDPFVGDFLEEDSLMPAMNVKEHKKDFAIEFAAPGFDKKDFEVSIEDDVLHVKAEKTEKEEEEEEGFMCKEFNYNSFRRSMNLPESVDLNQKVKATYKDGILKLNLLKNKEITKEAPKKIIEVS